MYLLRLLVAAWLLAGPTRAVTWYFLRYYTPSGARFTSFSGDMIVPRIPRAGVYYLWPGLQPTDGTGVYQNVLDGRKGTWWVGSGWCCENPNLPWGDGFNIFPGETVRFANELGSGNMWNSVLQRSGSGSSARNSFPLGES